MEQDDALNHRIAARVKALRSERGFTLDALAQRCEVSRSMISLVERGEASPTAVVLNKLAAGLGVTLSALLEDAPRAGPPQPLARLAAQPVWRDPDTGYVRRSVSPPGASGPVQIVEVLFPAGARVAFDNALRGLHVQQQVWLLEGRMEISHGDTQYLLQPGDCVAMALDQPTRFRNPTRKPARYAVVLHAEPTPRR